MLFLIDFPIVDWDELVHLVVFCGGSKKYLGPASRVDFLVFFEAQKCCF